MSETWRRWEGRTVAEKFPLQSYLGGSEHSAVFLTFMPGVARDPKDAAIKLISADDVDAEKQLRQWKAAGELNYSNLIRIFAAGRCDLDSTALLYVVMEYAEENLSQILPERALTAEETRGMLPAVLRAVHHVHDRGFVHGRIQPSNILAMGDQVKLSSDTLSLPGEINRGGKAASAYDPPESATGAILAPADVWQLGMALVEVLTQRLPRFDACQNKQAALPDGIPQPFREIVENCLRIDPAKRWTVTQIADRLEGRQPEPPALGPVAVPTPTPAAMAASLPSAEHEKRSAKWLYAMALVVAVLIVVFLIARPKPPSPALQVQSTQAQQSAAAESPQPAQTSTQPEPKPSPAAAGDANAAGITTATGDEAESATADESGVLHRVIPQVLPSARSTIQGKIKVRVRVTVDATGNVTQAQIESGGPSKYFSRIALQAARGWKFTPAQAGEQGTAREWNLQFAFSRTKTEVSAARARR